MLKYENNSSQCFGSATFIHKKIWASSDFAAFTDVCVVHNEILRFHYSVSNESSNCALLPLPLIACIYMTEEIDTNQSLLCDECRSLHEFGGLFGIHSVELSQHLHTSGCNCSYTNFLHKFFIADQRRGHNDSNGGKKSVGTIISSGWGWRCYLDSLFTSIT